MAEVTELDEIVLVTKMAWALKQAADLIYLDTPMKRETFYRRYADVHLDDYSPDLALRLDRKAAASEQQRRALEQTKVPA